MSNNSRPCEPKHHNHEVSGSTRISGYCEKAHNHRFATVSGDAIPCEESHVHEVKFTIDSCDRHHHEFCGKTEPAISVGHGHHVHVLKDCTSYDTSQKHEFIVSTLIENPTCK